MFGAFQNSGFLNKAQTMPQYRFFKFTPNSARVKNRKDTVQCLVRATVEDPLTDLPTENGPSFMNFAPDLASTPSEQLNKPTYVDYITRRIESEESRIKTASKLRSLVRFCN